MKVIYPCVDCRCPITVELPRQGAYSPRCAPCRKARLTANAKQAWIDSRDRLKPIRAAYYAQNKPYLQGLIRKNYFDNRAERLAKVVEYRKTFLGRCVVRAGNANTRANLWGCIGTISAETVYGLYLSSKGICYLCNEAKARWELDHFIPLSKGGSNTLDNLRICCPTCNRSKGAKLL